ncbi:MAG TPA: hypothetical protein VFB82_17620 [Blastocatellia bacterium]|jgi:sRNA-binding regulator protein Hfq|nr:hypothetical protein [Blastocatellia bacterium]
MKRSCLSIFTVLGLLLTQLQPVVFGQSTQTAVPAAQTARAIEPGSAVGNVQPPSVNRTTQNAPALDPAVEKVRRSVEKTGMAQKITVFLKNGDALHGAVTKIDRDEFAIAEVDFQRIFTIQYKDVKKTRSGYGEINLLTGKRVSQPKGVRIGVMAGLLFLIIGLPAIVLANTKD